MGIAAREQRCLFSCQSLVHVGKEQRSNLPGIRPISSGTLRSSANCSSCSALGALLCCFLTTALAMTGSTGRFFLPPEGAANADVEEKKRFEGENSKHCRCNGLTSRKGRCVDMVMYRSRSGQLQEKLSGRRSAKCPCTVHHLGMRATMSREPS